MNENNELDESVDKSAHVDKSIQCGNIDTSNDESRHIPTISGRFLPEDLELDEQFELVEDALIKRAIGFEHIETTKETVVDAKGNTKKKNKTVTKYVPPDVPACVFYLLNRTNDREETYGKWQNTNKLEIDISKGATMVALTNAMSPREIEQAYIENMKQARIADITTVENNDTVVECNSGENSSPGNKALEQQDNEHTVPDVVRTTTQGDDISPEELAEYDEI